LTCTLGLDGYRVLVTASTRGIGAAAARVMASCGARVAVNGRRRVEEAAERVGGVPVEGDLSREGEAARVVRRAAEALGGLDTLVYVPPPPPSGGFFEVSLEDWRLSYRLLVEAPIEAVREAVPLLEESASQGKSPSIVFVTSLAAWEPLRGIATSSVLRPALHGLTVLLARELGPRGVRVNAVVPGLFATDRLLEVASRRAAEQGVGVEEVLASMASEASLGRVGDPEEIGWVIAFLASPRASYVTGALVAVTGGRHVSVR